MNPHEEWRKGLASVFFNLAVVCFTIPVIDPILKGSDIRWANLGLAFLGLLSGASMLGIARLVLFYRKQ